MRWWGIWFILIQLHRGFHLIDRGPCAWIMNGCFHGSWRKMKTTKNIEKYQSLTDVCTFRPHPRLNLRPTLGLRRFRFASIWESHKQPDRNQVAEVLIVWSIGIVWNLFRFSRWISPTPEKKGLNHELRTDFVKYSSQRTRADEWLVTVLAAETWPKIQIKLSRAD